MPSAKVTLTMQAPIDLPGTWVLTDDGRGLVSAHVVAGNNEFRWEWTPVEHRTHNLVATFHPDCAPDRYCPPDATATLTYVDIEVYPTPSPTPTLGPGPFHTYIRLAVTPSSPAPAGTIETLTATVTQDVELTPGFGSLQFMDGSSALGAPAPVFVGDFSGNTASITTTLTPGTHSLTAELSPVPSFPVSNTVTYVVNPPTPTPTSGITPTTTTLQIFPDPGYTFLPEILIARVSPINAVGAVQFFDGNTPLGAPVRVSGGFAWSIARLPQGAHSLTAWFVPTNLGGCTTTAGFLGGPTPLPCPSTNVPAFDMSTSPPVALTVNSLL